MEFEEKLNRQGTLVGKARLALHNNSQARAFVFCNNLSNLSDERQQLLDELSQELYSRGISSLRLEYKCNNSDDDNPHTTELTAEFIEVAVQAAQERYECPAVILAGIGTGADLALESALVRQSIVGVVMLDGPGFRTHRFYFHRALDHYRPRALSTQNWLSRARRMSDLLSDKVDNADNNYSEALTDFNAELKLQELTQKVDAASQKNIALHFLFTGSVFHYYNYPGQLFDILKSCVSLQSVSESYLKHVDASFALTAHRTGICQDIVQWLEQHVSHSSSTNLTAKKLDRAA